jgi:hypothetical protein
VEVGARVRHSERIRNTAARALIGASLLSCSDPSARHDDVVASSSLPILVGSDDRTEPFDAPQQLKDVALASTVALLDAQRVVVSGAMKATLRARPATEALDLCPDQRFADQPVAARCSGVLIDDDLVATAGHCLGADQAASCAELRLIFGFWYAANGVQIEIANEDVFTCRRVIVRVTGDEDYAIVQLDRRPSGPRHPVTLGVRTHEGARLAVASHGAGLPLKLEAAAEVLEAPAKGAYFDAATDTFVGSSGGPLFDEAMQLVGLVQGGARDWESEPGCLRAALTEEGERHQHALPIKQALCDLGWPSATLCGTSARCGDAYCSADESSESCQTDCPRDVCGDGFCAWNERGACEVDCNRYDTVPIDWPLGLEAYVQSHPTPSYHAGGGCQVFRGHTRHVSGGIPEVLAALLAYLRRRIRASDRKGIRLRSAAYAAENGS